MAKRRSPNAVPEETADSFALLAPEDSPPEEPAAPATLMRAAKTVKIGVPMSAASAPRYSARHVEVQLDNEQASALTEILTGLDIIGARLKGGRRVMSAADGLRWLLDQLARGAAQIRNPNNPASDLSDDLPTTG